MDQTSACLVTQIVVCHCLFLWKNSTFEPGDATTHLLSVAICLFTEPKYISLTWLTISIFVMKLISKVDWLSLNRAFSHFMI